MRAFVVISGTLAGLVAILFAIGWIRGVPDPLESLPPALSSGGELTGPEASESLQAWADALPAPRTPLTTRYELRVSYPGEDGRPGLVAVDFDLVFGSFGRMRLDAAARADGEELLDGSLVVDEGDFWAWGDLSWSEDVRRIARGKVLRLPLESMNLFLELGSSWLGQTFGSESGAEAAELRLSDLLHPAWMSRRLVRLGAIDRVRVEDGELVVTARAGSGPLLLASLAARGSGAAELLAETPAELRFDPANGELLSAQVVGRDPRGGGTLSLELATVRREARADGDAFGYPDGLTMFDASPLVNMAMGLMRGQLEGAGRPR